MAFYAKSPKEIPVFLEQLLNPQIARAMIMAQKHTLPQHAGQAVCDFARAMVSLSENQPDFAVNASPEINSEQ